MDLPRQPLAGLVGQIEVVQRQGDRALAPGLEKLDCIFGDGALAGPLRAAEADDRAALAVDPPAVRAGRERLTDQLGGPPEGVGQLFVGDEAVEGGVAHWDAAAV